VKQTIVKHIIAMATARRPSLLAWTAILTRERRLAGSEGLSTIMDNTSARPA
jgi:hypothetical protein